MKTTEDVLPMKCTCGYERIDGAVLCRLIEGPAGSFHVEIYTPDNRLLAQSPEKLEVIKALEFVTAAAGQHSTHFHWEQAGDALRAQA